MRIDENDLMLQIINIISDNTISMKETKLIYRDFIDFFIDDLEVENFNKLLGEDAVFDEVYREYIEENKDVLEEEFEYDDE